MIHPGEILADELDVRGVSPAALAKALDLPTEHILEILRGRRDIGVDMAIRLGRWMGTGPGLWLNLQDEYERGRAGT